jgi:hypothetical protein
VVGTLLGFDDFVNMVLEDVVEYESTSEATSHTHTQHTQQTWEIGCTKKFILFLKVILPSFRIPEPLGIFSIISFVCREGFS